MNLFPKSWSWFREESGATLVETLVALSILVSVLLPASLFLGYVAFNPRNKDKIQAIGLAQSVMEQTLESYNFINKEKRMGKKWTIRQTVTRHRDLVIIDVKVYRMKDVEPIVSFHTERIYHKLEAADEKD